MYIHLSQWILWCIYAGVIFTVQTLFLNASNTRFKKLNHSAPDPNYVQEQNVTQYTWQQDHREDVMTNLRKTTKSVHDWFVTTGDTHSRISFRLFAKDSRIKEAASAARTTPQSPATAGEAVAKPDKTSATQEAEEPMCQGDTSSD